SRVVLATEHLGHGRERACERQQEEQREEDRRQEQRRRADHHADVAPGDVAGDREEARLLHTRASLLRSAAEALRRLRTTSATTKMKPYSNACLSQPKMNTLRMPSTRYETGFTVAIQ